MNAQTVSTGGCLCGAIRYRIVGSASSTNLCFCTQCQKQTGAPMPAFATYRNEQLTLSRGEPKSYSATPRATRQFCSDCGSSLFWREHDADTLDVFLGSFDQPDQIPPPGFAIWTAHCVSWLADLPVESSFPGARPARASDSL
jgi:hypothetical protein